MLHLDHGRQARQDASGEEADCPVCTSLFVHAHTFMCRVASAMSVCIGETGGVGELVAWGVRRSSHVHG